MLLIFGLGYTAARIAAAWPDATIGTTRDGRNGTLRFDDEPAVRAALATATHVLSSVPPEGDATPSCLATATRCTTAGSAICPRPASMATRAAPGSTKPPPPAPAAARRAPPPMPPGCPAAPMSSACPASTAPAARRSSAWRRGAPIVSACRRRCSAASMSTISSPASLPPATPRRAPIISPTIAPARRTTWSPSPPGCSAFRRHRSSRWRRSRRWRAPFTPRTAASRTARPNACSAGARPIPITGWACARSMR